MSKRMKFSKRYDHTFKATRAMLDVQAGYEGLVVDEVADGALAAGAAEEVPEPAAKPAGGKPAAN